MVFPTWFQPDSSIQEYSRYMVFLITDPIIGANSLYTQTHEHTQTHYTIYKHTLVLGVLQKYIWCSVYGKYHSMAGPDLWYNTPHTASGG